MLLGEGGTSSRLFVIFGLNEALLQLLVIAVLESLGDIIQRRCVKVGSQSLQVVLLHVGHAQVAVTDHLAELAVLVLSGIHLGADEGHECGLAAAVPSANRHPRAQGELARDLAEEVVLVLAIAEGEVLELDHCLGAGLHALHRAGDGEADLRRTRDGRLHGHLLLRALLTLLLIQREVAGQQGLDVVSLDALGHDESIEVSFRINQRLVLVGDNVGADLVEELGLVGNDHNGRLRQREEVISKPVHRFLIQVIRGLIQQDNVCVPEHGHGQGQPHAPSCGKLGHWHLKHLLWKANSSEVVCAGIRDANLNGLHFHVLQGIQAAFAHLSQLGIVDVNAAKMSRHAHNAAMDDLFHQCRFACSVVTNDTVATIGFQFEERVLQKELARPVHQQHVLHAQQSIGIVTLARQCVEVRTKGLTRHSLRRLWQRLEEAFGLFLAAATSLLEGQLKLLHDLGSRHLLLVALADDTGRNGQKEFLEVSWQGTKLSLLLEETTDRFHHLAILLRCNITFLLTVGRLACSDASGFLVRGLRGLESEVSLDSLGLLSWLLGIAGLDHLGKRLLCNLLQPGTHGT
mmetsp:Transcript_46615/g.110841  ORF Transcript_46615/g.110841 Transcript_46615/m.110841 type:complete len:574 (+) Transcript_46615:703-2424(+)